MKVRTKDRVICVIMELRIRFRVFKKKDETSSSIIITLCHGTANNETAKTTTTATDQSRR